VATVYDVGCGDGLFLQAASRLGLQIRGFEPEPVPRRQAEQRLRQRLDATMPKASHQSRFSAITCWQVIEHVRDPREFLRLLRGALKKNGLLAISTVNRNSWQARCFGVRWLHLDPPRHLWIGSMPTVRKMVEDAGFQVLEVFHRPLEFGPVGWVDSLWNFWGTERDRLLRCLKRGCWGPADRLLWLLSVALAPWAAVLAVAESLFGSPATFEIYARLDRKRARRQGG
jgi:SAM-dependent methyltransferase